MTFPTEWSNGLLKLVMGKSRHFIDMSQGVKPGLSTSLDQMGQFSKGFCAWNGLPLAQSHRLR
jgi:hypothetical protein